MSRETEDNKDAQYYQWSEDKGLKPELTWQHICEQLDKKRFTKHKSQFSNLREQVKEILK